MPAVRHPRRPRRREGRDEERSVARRAGGRAHAGLLAPRAPGPHDVNEPVAARGDATPGPPRESLRPGARKAERTSEPAESGERMQDPALGSCSPDCASAGTPISARRRASHGSAGVGVAGPDRRCSKAWPSPRPYIPGCRVPRLPPPPTSADSACRGGRPLADPGTFPALDPHRRPWPGREITSGGVTLHVRETPGPDGTPAVYVHGLGGSALNWTDLAALLGTRAAGTAVDLPGFGRTLPARRFRLHPGRAHRRPAVLPRRPQRAGAPGRQLPRRRGRARRRRATSRARPHADARLARHARPPPRPAAHGGRPARAGAGARPDRGTRSGRARRHRAARTCRADGPGLLRRPVARARAPARRGRRGDRPAQRAGVGPGGGGADGQGHGRELVVGRLAVGGRRAGAGADARRLGRPRPARLARAWPPAPRRRSRGRGC